MAVEFIHEIIIYNNYSIVKSKQFISLLVYIFIHTRAYVCTYVYANVNNEIYQVCTEEKLYCHLKLDEREKSRVNFQL